MSYLHQNRKRKNKYDCTFADKNSKTISIQKSEIIIYEVGSKVNRNNDKITGYHWLKRITIDIFVKRCDSCVWSGYHNVGSYRTYIMVRNKSYHPIGIVGDDCVADFDCCQTFDCKKDKQNSRKIIRKTGVVFDSQSFVLYGRCENSIFPCHQML